MIIKDEQYFMKKAIDDAKKALLNDEVPIGAVIVFDGKVIAHGRNEREKSQNSIKHAEIIAIEKACKKLGSWRLIDCDLYVTLEPCPMCSGAIINSRLRKVIFGAYDKKAGCCGTLYNLPQDERFNHNPQEVKGGVCESECAELLSDFFRKIREGKKEKKC